MANGFFMSQAQPLDYRPLIASAGAPAAGMMQGIQQGMQMRAQMQEMAAREQEQQAAAQQATAEEELNAIAMQASQGDPEAMQQLAALDPQAALQMQQVTQIRAESARAEEQEVLEGIGRVGSLMATSTIKTSRAVYNRAYERIIKEGGDITDFGLPTRAEAADMSDKELDASMKEVAPQLEAVAMGPEKAAEMRQERKEFEYELTKVDRTSLQKNLEAAGLKAGTPEYKKAMLDASKTGTTVNVGPQTESQRRDDFLASVVDTSVAEMKDALKTFDPTTAKAAIIGKLPFSNFFKTEAHQQFNAAARPVIEAYLVKITGAAYSEIQQSGAVETYMPQPGDKPGTVNKKINRIKDFAKLLKKSAGYAVDDPVPAEAGDITNLTPEEAESVPKPQAPAGPGKTVTEQRTLPDGRTMVKYSDGSMGVI